MKITKLTIKDYQQFENLELDFTYPADHPKAGQPLEKVCFIGANGTGKTTIMELLLKYLDKEDNRFFSNKKIEIDTYQDKINYLTQSIHYFPDDAYKIHNNKLYRSQPLNKDYSKPIKIISSNLKQNLIEIIKKLDEAYTDKVKQWLDTKQKDDTPSNPILPIFEWFSQIIPNLNFTYNKFENKKSFVVGGNLSTIIFTINGTEQTITLDQLSSGTRQLMYKLLPLYFEKDNLNDTFLFVDQPEDALFPDLQKQIVDIYTSLGQNNQYFFATHSDLIASQFEPCEIFRLEFGEDRKVFSTRMDKNLQPAKDLKYLSRNELSEKIFDIKDTIKKDKIIQAITRYSDITSSKLIIEENLTEVKQFTDGTHPEFGDILNKINYWG